MRLADDEIIIRIGPERLTLRPSLRAALRLNRQHDGFTNLAKAIADGNLTIIGDVIREAATEPFPGDLLAYLAQDSMRFADRLQSLQVQAIDFLIKLAGSDPDDKQPVSKPSTTPAQDQDTLDKHFNRLFGIATGWLGWTPKDAWAATPHEIVHAYQARLDMLKAIFGSHDDEESSEPHFERDEKAFNELKLMALSGQNRSR
jgi:hypothetical protein